MNGPQGQVGQRGCAEYIIALQVMLHTLLFRCTSLYGILIRINWNIALRDNKT